MSYAKCTYNWTEPSNAIVVDMKFSNRRVYDLPQLGTMDNKLFLLAIDRHKTTISQLEQALIIQTKHTIWRLAELLKSQLSNLVTVFSTVTFDTTILASRWLVRLFWYIAMIRTSCPFVALPPIDAAESGPFTQTFLWCLLPACGRPPHLLSLRWR